MNTYRSRRARHLLMALLVSLVALLLPLGAAHAVGAVGSQPGANPTGSTPTPKATPGSTATPGTPLGSAKPSAPSLKFGIGPANRVPKNQVVDGRPYLVYAANPGATILDRVVLLNYDPKPLRVQVYATDAVQSQEGNFGLLPGSAIPSDAGSWITMQGIPKDGYVVIPGRAAGKPYGVLRIPFIARIPASATPGDHTAGVIASLKVTSNNTKGAKITLDQRIAVRAYFALSGPVHPTLVIEDLQASYTNQWDPLGRGLYTVAYYVHNKGNLRLNVNQDVDISRCIVAAILCPVGDLIAHPTELHDLLPGSRIKVTQTFHQKFGLGRPSVTITLHSTALDTSYTKTIPDVSASVSFWALPWLLIIEIIVVLLLIGLGGWGYERRRRRKKRELEAAAAAPIPKHAAPLEDQKASRKISRFSSKASPDSPTRSEG